MSKDRDLEKRSITVLERRVSDLEDDLRVAFKCIDAHSETCGSIRDVLLDLRKRVVQLESGRSSEITYEEEERIEREIKKDLTD